MTPDHIDVFGSYDELADEYYDARLHPTCANLREASSVILRDWLRDFDENEEQTVVCEIGAGRSVLTELAAPTWSAACLILLDSSPRMLSQTLDPRGSKVVGDATAIPLVTGSVDVLVAVLGDPYNTPDFWSEAARVCRGSGTVMYTTPSYQWAHSFRSSEDAPFECAEFATASGAVLVPSLVHDVDDQRDMARGAKMSLTEYREVGTSVIAGPISSKFDLAERSGLPVVAGYRFSRDTR